MLLLLTVGISSNLKFIKPRFSNILIILILSFQIWSFSITLLDDFKIDSRIQAEAWIVENLNNLNFTEVGNNEFCTGDSPVKSFAETAYDHNFELVLTTIYKRLLGLKGNKDSSKKKYFIYNKSQE